MKRVITRVCGTMFTYGFLRGVRAEYHDNLYSTRLVYSFMNGVYYGMCVIHPVMRLMDRAQIEYQKLPPEKHERAYVETYGVNRNVIL
jgi:hypothetical protein